MRLLGTNWYVQMSVGLTKVETSNGPGAVSVDSRSTVCDVSLTVVGCNLTHVSIV